MIAFRLYSKHEVAQAWSYAFDQGKQGRKVRLTRRPGKGWTVAVH